MSAAEAEAEAEAAAEAEPGSTPVYFLIRYYPSYYACFAQGMSIFEIQHLSKCSIVRMYPRPSKDLTPALIQLQRHWKERRAYRRWASHPFRLFYRERQGYFPLYR